MAATKESAGDKGSAYESSVAQIILFELTRELRDYIYEYAFSGPRYQVTKHGGIPKPALLLTCKVIRDDASLTFYGDEKRLILEIASYDPAVLQPWCTKQKQLQKTHVIKLPKANHRHSGPRSWNNLKRTLQLRHGKLYQPISKSPVWLPRVHGREVFHLWTIHSSGRDGGSTFGCSRG